MGINGGISGLPLIPPQESVINVSWKMCESSLEFQSFMETSPNNTTRERLGKLNK